MATIALYANQINQMPGLLKEVKQSVSNYKSELTTLKNKTLTINKSICNLEDVISSIQSSTKTQEEKIASLDAFYQNSETFIADVVSIDNNVASLINKRKNDFYSTYSYLKPNCEKNVWEKFCDGMAAVGQWCKEHWKLIVTIVLVIAAIALLIVTAGMASGFLVALLIGIAKGILIGAVVGGVLGGLSSVAMGGSFWEGFEEGAFTGALTGALFGGLGVGGQIFGKLLGTSCKVFSVIKGISISSSIISLGMAGFDLLALGISLFDPNNKLVLLNQELHSNQAYNIFQFSVSALAVFSTSAYMTMKPMQKTCFVAGTMILTASGFIAIENIRAEDRVTSTNTDTFETSEKTVLVQHSINN